MPPLGLSARMRKARELTGRTLSLARTKPRMVVPGARYPQRRHDAILVLQRGPNASTDYYLRPRLDPSVRCEIVEIQSSPGRCGLLSPDGPQALLVILCRYASAPWLDALSAVRGRLARVAFFMDDDLPEMMRDPELPLTTRGKVARHFGEHVDRLSGLASELWVSTPVLAERYAMAHPVVVEPLPEADPPEPSPSPPRRVVYHGGDVHGRERRFVADVARLLQDIDPAIEVEMAGGAALRSDLKGRPNITVTPETPWPVFLDRQRGAKAAIALAPLVACAVNQARAPVKVFDAARLGAAGIYVQAPPFSSFVRDGVDGLLLPMEPRAWAGAIVELMDQPERRLALAHAARKRLVELRREAHAFPPPPA